MDYFKKEVAIVEAQEIGGQWAIISDGMKFDIIKTLNLRKSDINMIIDYIGIKCPVCHAKSDYDIAAETALLCHACTESKIKEV